MDLRSCCDDLLRRSACRPVAVILAVCLFPAIFSALPTQAAAATPAAQTVDKNDPAFFKKMYTDKKGNKMPYRVYVPENYEADKKYPLIVFFHSGSGRGFNNEQQILHENAMGAHVWTLPANQAQFPAFVLAPQCPVGSNWGDPDMNEINPKMQMALQILDTVQKDYSIDAGRIVLVGQSMGGLGVWALLQNLPDKWSAAVVLESYDNFTNLGAIAKVPLWLFQGDMDLIVPVDLFRTMVKQMRKAHAQLRYTEYHKMNQDIWDTVYAEPDLVPWVAAQKRGTPAARTN